MYISRKGLETINRHKPPDLPPHFAPPQDLDFVEEVEVEAAGSALLAVSQL